MVIRNIAVKLMIFLQVLFAISCMEEEFYPKKLSRGIELTPDYILPIGHGEISIVDIVKQSDTIRYNGDSIEIYIKKDSILTLTGEDFFNFPDQTTKDLRFDLGNRETTNETVVRSVTLNELADLMFPTAKGGISEGNNIFPAINEEQPGTVTLDSMVNFDWFEVSSGIIEMNLRNNLPVEINSLNIGLHNVDDDALVGNFTFSNIPSGSAQTRTADLTDKTVQNELYAEILDFYTPGSGASTVDIDFTDDLLFTIRTVNVRVRRGRAILPDQVFDADTTSIELDLENGEELEELHLESGIINYTLHSYINENVALSIVLPNTTKNGSIVTKYTLVNAMNAGATLDNVDLANTITMVEKNGIPAIYTTSLVSSNQMVTFDFSDTVNYNSTVEKVDIVVSSAIGYFGNDTIQVTNESFENQLDLFSKFEGEFELTNPQINIVYNNSYGIPLDLNLDFIGKYTEGENVNLATPAATFNHPLNPDDEALDGIINYNKNNLPDIVNFLKFPPPDTIHYSGTAISNPNGKTATSNFINNTSEITVGIELKLPLELLASDIMLQDTIVFDGFNNDNQDNTPNEEDGNTDIAIENASLAYKIKNSFPLDLDFQIVLYDSINDTRYDTVDVGFLDAAPVDSRGIVIPEQIEETRGVINISDSFIDNLELANKLIIIGRLNTSPDNNGVAQPVKILTSCSIEFYLGLVAKMKIKTNFNGE